MPLSRQIPDAQWQALVHTTLQHRITHTPRAANDEFAQPTYGPKRHKVRCYIDGTTRRVLDAQHREVQAQWQVFFEGSATVGIDDLLEDGKDLDGNVLLASAKVISIDDNVHQDAGRLLRTAYCAMA